MRGGDFFFFFSCLFDPIKVSNSLGTLDFQLLSCNGEVTT